MPTVSVPAKKGLVTKKDRRAFSSALEQVADDVSDEPPVGDARTSWLPAPGAQVLALGDGARRRNAAYQNAWQKLQPPAKTQPHLVDATVGAHAANTPLGREAASLRESARGDFSSRGASIRKAASALEAYPIAQ